MERKNQLQIRVKSLQQGNQNLHLNNKEGGAGEGGKKDTYSVDKPSARPTKKK